MDSRCASPRKARTSSSKGTCCPPVDPPRSQPSCAPVFPIPLITPFHGGFQAGLLVQPAFPSRPDSQMSLGMHHAWTSNHYRDALRALDQNPGNETALELTYADVIAPSLSLQPDVQWVHGPGGLHGARDVIVVTTRMTWSF